MNVDMRGENVRSVDEGLPLLDTPLAQQTTHGTLPDLALALDLVPQFLPDGLDGIRVGEERGGLGERGGGFEMESLDLDWVGQRVGEVERGRRGFHRVAVCALVRRGLWRGSRGEDERNRKA